MDPTASGPRDQTRCGPCAPASLTTRGFAWCLQIDPRTTFSRVSAATPDSLHGHRVKSEQSASVIHKRRLPHPARASHRDAEAPSFDEWQPKASAATPRPGRGGFVITLASAHLKENLPLPHHPSLCRQRSRCWLVGGVVVRQTKLPIDRVTQQISMSGNRVRSFSRYAAESNFHGSIVDDDDSQRGAWLIALYFVAAWLVIPFLEATPHDDLCRICL
jgi:hypothetical protein